MAKHPARMAGRSNSRGRLVRDEMVIFEGKISSLKRFKDEVKEVQSGQECGMAFENYDDIRPGEVRAATDPATPSRTQTCATRKTCRSRKTSANI